MTDILVTFWSLWFQCGLFCVFRTETLKRSLHLRKVNNPVSLYQGGGLFLSIVWIPEIQ